MNSRKVSCAMEAGTRTVVSAAAQAPGIRNRRINRMPGKGDLLREPAAQEKELVFNSFFNVAGCLPGMFPYRNPPAPEKSYLPSAAFSDNNKGNRHRCGDTGFRSCGL